ncbi:exodeoxyribonuclease V subunit alpha [Buchnera aphidicola (Neophyllaphis podocarpi)]|uniref:exodeoxyribonuclease V subunit alpha n=1 Tax=Buchnera aphidicola TaxID=9 RepID=UPI0031B87C0B
MKNTKIIKLLKKAAKKSIINYIDIYFAESICNIENKKIFISIVCLSYNFQKGNSCLPISKIHPKLFNNNNLIKKIFNIIGNNIDWNLKLKNSQIIGDKKNFLNKPIILNNKKLYLNKIWKEEVKIFEFIKKNININTKINNKKYNKIIYKLSNNENYDLTQKKAISIALKRKITFIIGGPGTGKTTIIFTILKYFIKLSKPNTKIKLLAPTGKATFRLKESIKNSIKLDKSLNKKIINYKIETIHKFLEENKKNEKENIINKKKEFLNIIDLIIIDESSMVDLYIISKLLNIINRDTKIIFVGDPNQLYPVKHGSFLKDISYFYNIVKKQNNNFIRNNICKLKENYRFSSKSDIHNLAIAIHNKEIHKIYKIINKKNSKIIFFDIKSDYEYKNTITNIVNNYKLYWLCVKNELNPKKIIKIFNQNKVLCMMRIGKLGIKKINKKIEKQMINEHIIQYEKINDWYIGKPIMIIKNNNELKLSNGDIGITIKDKNQEMSVFFIKNNNIKKVKTYLINEYETAWAITVHKSQGSEFENISLIIPEKFSNFLTKELIFTAVTRAKKTVSIYSTKKILNKIINNEGKRDSGMIEKLLHLNKKK